MRQKYSALILCSCLLSILSCGKKQETTKPVRKDIVQAVYASGKLFPTHHYTVFSKFPGYVQNVFVNAGEDIKIGQRLITIKNEVSQLNTSTAKNQLELAIKNADESGPLLRALSQDISNAKSKYRLDSINFIRQSELLLQSASSQIAFDQAKTQSDISKQNLIKAIENYNSTKSRLEIELNNARNLFEAQKSTENEYSILSILNGKVYDVLPQPGDFVTPQTSLMEIGDIGLFEVELSVDETDIALIKSGQEIVYSFDAYPDKFFKGQVTEIFPRVISSSKTSRIKRSFTNIENIPLYSGMSAEANILIRESKNALVIPKEFIKGNEVRIKGKENNVKIVKGAEDLQFVEIKSGISQNDILIK